MKHLAFADSLNEYAHKFFVKCIHGEPAFISIYSASCLAPHPHNLFSSLVLANVERRFLEWKGFWRRERKGDEEGTFDCVGGFSGS